MKTNFDQINFTSKFHQYTYNGTRLRSATNFIGQFSKPFDREKWSEYCAKRDGITVEEVLKDWDTKGKESREKGHMVHKHIENVLLGKVNLFDKFTAMSEWIPEQVAFNNLWTNGLSEQVQVLQTEWVIGDEELGIGGTVDALFMDIDDQSIYIFDWKTGKFTDYSEYGNKLLEPFADFDECKLQQYSLQASLYRLIIERNTDIKINDCKIVHLTESGKFYIYTATDHTELLLDVLMAQLLDVA